MERLGLRLHLLQQLLQEALLLLRLLRLARRATAAARRTSLARRPRASAASPTSGCALEGVAREHVAHAPRATTRAAGGRGLLCKAARRTRAAESTDGAHCAAASSDTFHAVLALYVEGSRTPRRGSY